jgi:hypothetical protein
MSGSRFSRRYTGANEEVDNKGSKHDFRSSWHLGIAAIAVPGCAPRWVRGLRDRSVRAMGSSGTFTASCGGGGARTLEDLALAPIWRRAVRPGPVYHGITRRLLVTLAAARTLPW